MQNKSLKFVLLLLIFVILFDWIFGKVYSALYFTEKSQNIDRLIHSAIGTNEDVLIFGSSRAYHHYNPEIFEKELGLGCFNVGYGGQNIYYHLALLKAAIQRCKTKVAILDLISIDIEETKGIHDKEKLGVLLPFVNNSTIYKETVLLRGYSEKFKLASSIYPFNSKQLYMIRNNISSARSDVKGYVGLDRVWDKSIETKIAKELSLDKDKMNALFEFIELCKVNKIQIFIFVSPHYVDFKDSSSFAAFEKKMQEDPIIHFYNFENNPKYISNAKYFSDPYHLNKTGSDLYSKEVADLIKMKLNK
jgi:hypothetical protein